jgi:ABC-type transport system involved in multi-copper enzyme maturation permease subunit
MLSIHNIWTVTRFEIKTLLRSWFFRIFAGLAILLLLWFNILIMTGMTDSPHILYGLGPLIPYMNMVLLNIVQSIIVIFLASDFLKRDKKLDTTEVIYMRSMTNGDYVLGKTMGILFVFAFLNITIILIALIINLLSPEVPFSLQAYLYYPLLISLPAIVFMLGLSFFSMTLLRNQAVTFVLLLGFAALTLFYLNQKFYYMLDYMAFNLPLFASDFVGLSNPATILLQRGMYFLLGVAMIFCTILFLRRLPQSQTMQKVSIIVIIAAFIGAFYTGYVYVDKISQRKSLRAEMLSLEKEMADYPLVTPLNYDLQVEHQGNVITANVKISFQNQTEKPVDRYLFQLNPGLQIIDITKGQSNLTFERKKHLFWITPELPLRPGASDSLIITYTGFINENACYLETEEAERDRIYRIWFSKLEKRYAFITDDYLLLTPEATWYPVPAPGNSFSFATYSLKIVSDPALLPISQGQRIQEDEGVYLFKPEQPLPAISLSLGPYTERKIEVDSVTFALYTHKDHNFFVAYTDSLADTLSALIRDLKQDYERKLELEYPYKRFSLVEAPILLYAHPRMRALHQEVVQPEMVFIPENGLTIRNADFKGRMRREKDRRERDNQTVSDMEMQANIMRGFLQETVLSAGFGRYFGLFDATVNYHIFPNYYTFAYHLSSATSPYLNFALESFYHNRLSATDRWPFRWDRPVEEIAAEKLGQMSLSELIDTETNIGIIQEAINLKGDYLFSMLQQKSMGEQFLTSLNDMMADNRFRVMNDTLFFAKIAPEMDRGSYLQEWYNQSALPGFSFTDPVAYEIIDGDRTRYQILFKGVNLEEVEGIITVSFQAGGRGGGRGRFGPRDDTEIDKRFYYFAGDEAKEVGIVLDEKPGAMDIHTVLSKNLPQNFNFRFAEIEADNKLKAMDGEKNLPGGIVITNPNEIIVDNEDSTFQIEQDPPSSPLKRLLNIEVEEEEKYIGLNFWRAPTRWRATIQTGFYGKYVKSAYYTRGGDGSRRVIWNAQIPSSGTYDVFCYQNKLLGPMRFGRRRNEKTDYHYQISHDDGVEEVAFEDEEAGDGWNYLGTFYFSEGSSKVELTNKSEGRILIADAVKWVKR